VSSVFVTITARRGHTSENHYQVGLFGARVIRSLLYIFDLI